MLCRLTPAGLLKKSAALNPPNYGCFGCEAEKQKQGIIQYLQDGKTTESGLTRQTEM